MPQGGLSGGFPESLRGHFQGVSESILRASSRVFEHELEPKLGANSNLNWNAHLKPKLDLGLKREIELGLELSNSNSNSDSNAATQTRTRELELEPELYFGLQRALERDHRIPSLAELPLHFFSGDQYTRALPVAYIPNRHSVGEDFKLKCISVRK